AGRCRTGCRTDCRKHPFLIGRESRLIKLLSGFLAWPAAFLCAWSTSHVVPTGTGGSFTIR
ncbi:MAG: hypothetical protein ABGX05_14300, partial [Pirellulaceae bacterium]